MPILVVHDCFTKALFDHLVSSKGIEYFYFKTTLIKDIKFLGYTKLGLKSDQESSILAFANVVKNTLALENVIY